MNRRLAARLGRLEEAVAPPADGPVCRFHGQHCEMGRNWPLDRAAADPVGVQMDDLMAMIQRGRREAGLPADPTPCELWAVERHEQVPAAELAQYAREAAEALAEAKAKNAVIEAELRGEQP